MLPSLLTSLLKIGLGKKKDEASLTPIEEVRQFLKKKELAKAREILDPLLTSEPENIHVLVEMGELEYQSFNDQEAIEYFQNALHLRPEYAPAHYGMSKVLYDKQQYEEADKHALYAHARDRTNAGYAAQYGLCNLALGNYVKAHKSLKASIQFDPGQAKVINNLGIACRALGLHEEAKGYFIRALFIQPELEIAHRNLVSLYTEQNDLEKAAAHENILKQLEENILSKQGDRSQRVNFFSCGESNYAPIPTVLQNPLDQMQSELEAAESEFAEEPESPQAALRLAKLLGESGEFREAVTVIEIGLAHNPDAVELIGEKGRLLAKLDRHQEALFWLQKAIDQAPEEAAYYRDLAQSHLQMERPYEALAAIQHAFELDSSLRVRLELAGIQINACRYDEALENIRLILSEAPEMAAAIDGNLAILLTYLGRFDEAREKLSRVLALEPNNLEYRFFSATIYLLHGDYRNGWEDYRYRIYADSRNFRILPIPDWNGEPLEGKRILLLAEQGFGDQVMFASCIQEVLEMNPGKLYIECHQRLEKTFERSFPNCEIIPTQQTMNFDWFKRIETPDYYIPIASLPRHFRESREAFQRFSPFLRTSDTRVRHWQERLAAVNSKPKIGLTWRGGLQKTRRAVRSLELPLLLPLFRQTEFQFVNLQYGKVADEIREAEEQLEISLLNWPEAIEDLDEFAALIGALDLVITVCNTTVHFAGALGEPVWVMAPRIPEWRYGLESENMDWYPSVRMFRQQVDGEWVSLIQSVADALPLHFLATELPTPLAQNMPIE